MTSYAEAVAGVGIGARMRDYLQLAKPRVVPLIALTTAVGYYLGSGPTFDSATLVLTLIGTMLAASGALALNQLLERDLDGLMKRTANRPLPAGRLQPLEALAFGVAMVALGLALLTFAVDPVAGMVTALTVLLYLFAYTPLKRRSSISTLIGAVPGALPPVTGWAAATGGVEIGAWSLFGLLFFWQIPHSLAIARMYRDDYARAGYQLLPVVDRDGRGTGRQSLLNAFALLGASMVPALVGIAGLSYLVTALVLGVALLVLTAMFAVDDSVAHARRLFFGSLAYMPLVLVALVVSGSNNV